ncbi:MAG: hypothetical protein KO206_09405 [Methanomicrobiaceae archaeon]|nr:hypothetical protein [Methanomicrobiaceae archaeon]MDD5419024.1 hypothetical protein [Methanomicrobiaceae archaeon]
MDVLRLRTWAIFYLFSFVVLLVALFLTIQGALLWISLTLVIIVIGLNFFALFSEVKRHKERKAFLQKIYEADAGASYIDSSGRRW